MHPKFFERVVQNLGIERQGLEFLLRVRDEGMGAYVLPHEKQYIVPYISERIIVEVTPCFEPPDFIEPLSDCMVELTPFGQEFLKYLETYHSNFS